MSGTVQSLTADCLYCGKPVRRNAAGVWGARRHDDPHPWYCDDGPDADKRHAPSPARELTEGPTEEGPTEEGPTEEGPERDAAIVAEVRSRF